MSEVLHLPINQGHSLGPFVLGASVHHVLTRIKSLPTEYPRIQLSYSQAHPVLAPVIINLPANGIRLRFDGPEQRLRLIEVMDFSKSHLTYKGHDISKAKSSQDIHHHNHTQFAAMSLKTGPSFRNIYKVFGPTTPGEYIPPQENDTSGNGTYCLSYPGIAFSFPLTASSWKPSLGWANVVSLLSSSATGPVASLCLFLGESWTSIRSKLFSSEIPIGILHSPIPHGLRKEFSPKEIAHAKIYDRGRVELVRKDAPNFWLILGETTPQDLVTELGPPDTIHKKNDRRVAIHRQRKGSTNVRDKRRDSSTSGVHVDVASRTGIGYSESDPSSRAVSSESDDDEDDNDDDEEEEEDNHNLVTNGKRFAPEQTFYNYYSHGFDILIGPATPPSAGYQVGQAQTEAQRSRSNSISSNAQVNPPIPSIPETPVVLPRSHMVATKIIIHGNVPGSWSFNRHRRLQWSIQGVPDRSDDDDNNSNNNDNDNDDDDSHHYYHHHQTTSAPPRALTSERSWRDLESRLAKVFADHYSTRDEARLARLPMVVNRGWGRDEGGTDSEWGIVGGWEDGAVGVGNGSGNGGVSSVVRKGDGSQDVESERLGAAELYGFPGLVFEVLKNGSLSSVMVY